MAKTHNKKRNVGIIYEQLLRSVSQALVEHDEPLSSQALRILRSRFTPGTELYKEFRLFNALVKTTVPNESLATRILSEAHKAALDHDSKKLRAEKSDLIREINHTLPNDEFYKQRVPHYRSYATIQTLLNDWRNPDGIDLSRVAKYESQVVEWLVAEKASENLDEHRTTDVNELTVKIMTEKFNRKYGAVLNEEQREIISAYVFSQHENAMGPFVERLKKVKSRTLNELNIYSATCGNKTLNEKMTHVMEGVKAFNENEVNDETLAKFLLLSKLKYELTEGE